MNSVPGKPKVFQNVIFLSDGNSRDDVLAAAENFHKNGIRLTSVWLGKNNKKYNGMEKMKKIIGSDRVPPLSYVNHYFESKDPKHLSEMVDEMMREIVNCN